MEVRMRAVSVVMHASSSDAAKVYLSKAGVPEQVRILQLSMKLSVWCQVMTRSRFFAAEWIYFKNLMHTLYALSRVFPGHDTIKEIRQLHILSTI